MNTNGLVAGDKIQVVIDYGSGLHRGKRALIVKFQQNGFETFAKINWLGNSSNELKSEYGVLFNVRDLKRII